MSITDHISAAQEKVRVKQDRAQRNEELVMGMQDSIATRAFRNASTRYGPKIAEALVTDGYFKVRVDGVRATPVQAVPMKILTKIWSSGRSDYEIDTWDVERNDAYKRFRQDLEAQGIYIKSMEVFTQTGLNWKRYAKMKLGTDPTPEPRWSGLM